MPGPKKEKKAEMGVGTLIVFIAMLLVAAVAAGVIMQTATSLQQKSVSTGRQAKSQISTNVRVYEVSATDGSNGNLTDFHQIIKTSPGSDPVKLDEVLFTFSTNDATTTLKYRGKGSVCEKNNNNGYNTWETHSLDYLEENQGLTFDGASPIHRIENSTTRIKLDLDEDGINDTMQICDDNGPCPSSYAGTYFMFNLSSDGIKYVHLVQDDGTEIDTRDRGSFDFNDLDIKDYATIKMERNSGSYDYVISELDNGASFTIIEKPRHLEEDYNDDQKTDKFGLNKTHAIMHISGKDNYSVPLGKNICTDTGSISKKEEIKDSEGNEFATVKINADLNGNCKLPDGSVTIVPYHKHRGYFSAIYETKGSNHRAGTISRGDVVRMCYEAPGEITESQEVRLNLIPKLGTPTPVSFITPEVMSRTRVYLYP